MKKGIARISKLIPNSLTLCNSICGFVAIVYMLQVYDPAEHKLAIFATSSWIIVFAMIFDVLDGFAARLFHAESMHGVQMDSLADMVTFGVAPATICAIMAHALWKDDPWTLLIYALCAIYLGCAALRLATYNVKAMTAQEKSKDFSGLPSPGAAAGVCSMAMLLSYFDINYPEMKLHKFAVYIPIYAAALGILMITPIPYPHAGKWFFSAWRNKWRVVSILCILSIIMVFRERGLFVIINIYIFSGPIKMLVRLFRPRRRARA